jgi:formyltetrahydrofolate synthetase
MASADEMHSTLDRLGSSLTSAILGALILWVGQTTFRHAGILAGIDEKIVAINKQFVSVDQRQEGMRKWLENMVNDIKDSNRSQFTQTDGDKLASKVREAEQSSVDLERRFADRISALDVKLTALETQHRDSQEVAALKTEIAQLRSDLTRAAVAQEVSSQSGDRFARGNPVFLPPVEARR